MAEHLATQPDKDAPAWRPRPAEWTLMHELMARQTDRLGAIASLLSELPTPIKERHAFPEPFPRPETELDKARKRIEQAKIDEYDERLLGAVERAKQRWREGVRPDGESVRVD